MIDLRLGRWEDVLADVRVDAIVTDPPYGARVHEGYKTAADLESQGADAGLNYAAWTADDVSAFVSAWSPRCAGWMVALTSHDLIPAWEAAYRAAERYAFQPLPCVLPGMTVRLMGGGPSSWAVYAMVARPRTPAAAAWGTLPGAYITRQRGGGGGRGKPAWLCEALIRDYTRPGDVVCDPCAGHGAILAAAESLGRRAIGAEVDPVVHATATAATSNVQLGLL